MKKLLNQGLVLQGKLTAIRDRPMSIINVMHNLQTYFGERVNFIGYEVLYYQQLTLQRLKHHTNFQRN